MVPICKTSKKFTFENNGRKKCICNNENEEIKIDKEMGRV